ncbi:MAG: hypothetical protein WAZ48_07730 [Lysobacteraceae bacterium]
MNACFIAAAVLAFVVGLVHSVLGEIMIFRRMRKPGRVIPTDGGAILLGSNVRILWASWHVLTVFGWGMAAILVWMSRPASGSADITAIGHAIEMSMLIGSVLVLVATKGRHPGWIGLLGVAALVWLGRTM